MLAPLQLTITSPESLSELARYGDIYEQQQIALVAIDIGLKALGIARGEIDRQSLQEIGEQILSEVQAKIELTLEQQTNTFQYHFSLDNPDSAMKRFSDQSQRQYFDLQTNIAKYFERKQVQRRSTQGGAEFEDLVGDIFSSIVSHTGDGFEPTGTIEGKILRNKVGDFVVTLGHDCAAAGERIVIEAKRDQSYTHPKICEECQTACKNRDAQVAIFVWDRSYGEAKQQPPLMREGNFVIALWDAEEPMTDIYLQAAFWLARGLIIPKTSDQRVVQAQRKLVDDAFVQLASIGDILEEIKKSGDDIGKKAEKITKSAGRVHSLLTAGIEDLQAGLSVLNN